MKFNSWVSLMYRVFAIDANTFQNIFYTLNIKNINITGANFKVEISHIFKWIDFWTQKKKKNTKLYMFHWILFEKVFFPNAVFCVTNSVLNSEFAQLNAIGISNFQNAQKMLFIFQQLNIDDLTSVEYIS